MSHSTQEPPRGWDRNDRDEWGTPPPRPPKAKRSIGGLILKILAVVGALVVLLVVAAVACAPSATPPPPPVSSPAGGTLAPVAPDPNAGGGIDEDGRGIPAAVQAELTVEGTGKATVTYGNETGGTNQETVTLPWRKSLPDESLITLTGMSTSGKSTKITCTIGRPGIDPVTSTSNGTYATCTAIGGL